MSSKDKFMVHTMIQDGWGRIFLPGDHIILNTKKNHTYRGKIKEIDQYTLSLEFRATPIYIPISNIDLVHHYHKEESK